MMGQIREETQLMLTNPHDAFRGQSRCPFDTSINTIVRLEITNITVK